MPQAVRQEACRHILDALGCGLGALRFGEGGAARRTAAGLGGPAEATLIGGGKAAAPNAALGNGTMIHALDFDDTHADSLVHLTVAVFPAALAAAEERGASGADLLVAQIAGMEVAARLGAAVRHGFHGRGFHATSICGTFASALAAARLHGFDEQATVNALGIAGSFAAGSLQFLQDGSPTKPLHAGWAAHSGLMAARLAAAGAAGPARIFEGEHGLYRAYAGAEVDPARLTDGLGGRWEIPQTTIKPYPACQLSHASLDALRATGVAAADVLSIRFRIPAESADIVARPEQAKLNPRTPYEAKFSLQWCAAALLIDGYLGIESFEADRISRPDVLALAAKIGFETFHPGQAAAAAPGWVEVTLGDGSRRLGEVGSSRGGPERPLDDAELLEKFRLNAGPGQDALARAALELEWLGSVAELAVLLGQPAVAAV